MIDVANMSAEISIFVIDQFVTSYTFSNNEVTLSERPNIDVVTIPNLKNNIEQILKWIKLIIENLNPVTGNLSRFENDLKKTNNNLNGKFECKGDNISDVQFNDNTKLSTFQPRPERVMKFKDFVEWSKFLNKFLYEILNF